MQFELSARQRHWKERVRAFMNDHVRPRHSEYRSHVRCDARWSQPALIEELKSKAQEAGLWNLFMPPAPHIEMQDTEFQFEGEPLTNLEYALCAEEMGRVRWSPEVFNCSAPDTGNMELLHRFGTRAQKEKWLRPLMRGDIRSVYLMTEPAVASSDATNIATQIERDGDHYVINGRKWWSSGLGSDHCKVAILMGKTDPKADAYRQQSQIIVPLDTPGIKIERMLTVFGFDDAPHGHAQVVLENVRVPVENVLLGEGRGFEMAQARLGPGRIHHCMRAIGTAEEALSAMVIRLQSRTAFGKRISEHSVWEERVARARTEIQAARLLCLFAADTMDREGNKAARTLISMIKIYAPAVALRVVDDAIQAHGGAGVSQDYDLATFYTALRGLRIADGPDEVHNRAIARAEFRAPRDN